MQEITSSSPRDIAGTLLSRIAERGGASRAELARETGWARSTVSQWIDRLGHAGLVVEGEAAVSAGGRPAIPVRLNPSAGKLLTATFGATHARIGVSDLRGDPLGETEKTVRLDQGPDHVLDWTQESFRELLGQVGATAEDVRAITIGLPGPVHFVHGRVVRPPIMPGWDGYPVKRHFAARYPAPVIVDNDVNLMALGALHDRFRDVDHLLFVKIGTGIGCGIVVDRRLHRGADGSAGDIGHIPVADSTEVCNCGREGCLEAVAGASAIAGELKLASPIEIAALVHGGDPKAVHAIRRAGQRIGRVLAGLVSFANPAAIVLGGSLAGLRDILLTEIRSAVIGQATDLATRALRIEISPPEVDVARLGAVALGREAALSPEAVRRLVEKSS
ncbi:ROK family protein [Saccharothrix violaceirubra]|uniref:Putative NBD/HSP70 family sugar kinase n=1 Tax=Saccharothrix violaceirubra TaxID=413306 RepID=A0A7W7SYT5_9PSEU|nr:ROK family transcriptional regulator [Saccharothrix violaceirubra]MBB4963459.1 putative NBD/HSP70 family sugar kinase [Saccharothrix violaceirubra]